jgi:hypothetical protein
MIRLIELVAVVLVGAGVVGFFVRAAYGWDIPAETLVSTGIGILGGRYAGAYFAED